MTLNNYIDDDEYYKDLKKFMIKNFDVYISHHIYDIDDDLIIK